MNKGFTLIEILVAAGIFASLLVVIVGIFARFTFVQRKDIGEQLLQEDLRFAMQLFTREASFGYGSTFDVTNNGSGVVFRNEEGRCVHYQLRNGAIERAEQDQGGQACDPSPFASLSHSPVTSSSVTIDEAASRFDPVRAHDSDGDGKLESQGFITLMLTATPSSSVGTQPFVLQTTATARQSRAY